LKNNELFDVACSKSGLEVDQAKKILENKALFPATSFAANAERLRA